MPKLTVNGETVTVEKGKRLVLAIEEMGINNGHRCGGYAKCTTCRVEFLQGEPAEMTQAEYDRLTIKKLYGKARLACQIVCDHDMSVNVLMTAENQPDWNGDTGPMPAPVVTPETQTHPRQTLEQQSRDASS